MTQIKFFKYFIILFFSLQMLRSMLASSMDAHQIPMAVPSIATRLTLCSSSHQRSLIAIVMVMQMMVVAYVSLMVNVVFRNHAPLVVQQHFAGSSCTTMLGIVLRTRTKFTNVQ